MRIKFQSSFIVDVSMLQVSIHVEFFDLFLNVCHVDFDTARLGISYCFHVPEDFYAPRRLSVELCLDDLTGDFNPRADRLKLCCRACKAVVVAGLPVEGVKTILHPYPFITKLNFKRILVDVVASVDKH